MSWPSERDLPARRGNVGGDLSEDDAYAERADHCRGAAAGRCALAACSGRGAVSPRPSSSALATDSSALHGTSVGGPGGTTQASKLVWVPSGQLSISGAVGVCDADANAVGFLVEVRPGWYYGVASEPPNWVVELSVEADCLHELDHEAMETVYDAEVVAYSPRAAVEMLTHEVERLADLARSNPPEHWTRMTRD